MRWLPRSPAGSRLGFTLSAALGLGVSLGSLSACGDEEAKTASADTCRPGGKCDCPDGTNGTTTCHEGQAICACGDAALRVDDTASGAPAAGGAPDPSSVTPAPASQRGPGSNPIAGGAPTPTPPTQLPAMPTPPAGVPFPGLPGLPGGGPSGGSATPPAGSPPALVSPPRNPIALAIEPAKLIPDGATLVGGVDMRALTQSSVYTQNRGALDQMGWSRLLGLATGCNLDPEKFEQIIFATDMQADGAFVVVGDGVGDRSNLQCVAKIAGLAGLAASPIQTKGGQPYLALPDAGMGAFLLQDNAVVLTTLNWSDDIAALLEGKGRGALQGSLADAIEPGDRNRDLWLAGQVPAELGAMIDPGHPADVMAATVDVRDGMDLEVRARFQTDQVAQNLASQANASIGQALMLAPMLGVPASLANSLSITSKGRTVRLKLKLTDAELAQLQNALTNL